METETGRLNSQLAAGIGIAPWMQGHDWHVKFKHVSARGSFLWQELRNVDCSHSKKNEHTDAANREIEEIVTPGRATRGVQQALMLMAGRSLRHRTQNGREDTTEILKSLNDSLFVTLADW